MRRIVVFSLLAVMILAGCAYKTGPAVPATGNVQLLRSYSAAKPAALSSPAGQSTKQFYCTEKYAISLRGESSAADYIRWSLQSELEAAGLYEQDSPRKISISGVSANLETDVPVRSIISSMRGGRWTIKASLAQDGQKSFEFGDYYYFRIRTREGWKDKDTCRAAAQAFGPAVQSFLNKLYRSPQFQAMLGIPIPPPPPPKPSRPRFEDDGPQEELYKYE